MSSFVGTAPCVLSETETHDKNMYSNIGLIGEKQYNIPFFTTYRESISYSGTEWMTVKETTIDNQKIYYIEQNAPPPKPVNDTIDRFNLIFMPHLWKKYDNDAPIFSSQGELSIYYKNDEFKPVNMNDYNVHYYSVHDDGGKTKVISDSTEIPEEAKSCINYKKRLFVKFKWNNSKDDYFYGIYDFRNTVWTWNKIEGDQDSSHYTYTVNNNSNIDDTEICEAMTEFMNYIKSIQPSSDKKSAIVAIKEGGGGSLAKSSSTPKLKTKKGDKQNLLTSQSVSNLHAGTSTAQTIFAVENGGGASASSTQIPVAPYCIGTYNMSWANEFLPLQKLFKNKDSVKIEDIKKFVGLYKYSSERTFLAQNNIVENTIQEIEDILNSSDQVDVLNDIQQAILPEMFKFWEKTIDHLYSFFINKSPSAVGLQEINKDSTAIKEMLGKVNAYKQQYSKTKYIEIKEYQRNEPFVALSIIIDTNVFGNMIKQDIYETDLINNGRPLLIVLTKKDNKYFLFANVHGKNNPPIINAAMIEQSVTNKVIDNMKKFIGGLTQDEKTGIQEIFVMGDFNDKFDNIKNIKFDIDGTPKTVSFNGDAPKSCCHNWDSSCSEEITNKRIFNNKIAGKCDEPTRTGTQVFESNKLYSDDKKTTVVSMKGHGNSIKDYKYAGDKVFGLNPWTHDDNNNIYDNTLQIFNPNDGRTLSNQSDHELVYGYFKRGDATKTYDKKLFIIGGPISVDSKSSFHEFKKYGADVKLFATFGNHSNATFQGKYNDKSFWTDTQTKIKDTIYGIAFDVGSGSWFTSKTGWFENVTELITTVLKDYGILVLDKYDSREFITYLNDNKKNISLEFKGYVGKYLVYAKQIFDLSQGVTIPFFSKKKDSNNYDENIAKYLQMYKEFLETTAMGERIVSQYSKTPDPTSSSTSNPIIGSNSSASSGSTSNLPPPPVGPSSNLNPVSTSNQPSGNLSGSISGSNSSASSSASSGSNPVSTPPPPPVSTSAEIFIKVVFEGTIPTKVEIVTANAIPAGAGAPSKTLQDYINTELFGTPPPSGTHEKYFKLTQDDQDLMKEMIA